MALGGDRVITRYIKNWILGRPNPTNLPIGYHSDIHRTTINTMAYAKFLINNNTPAQYHTIQLLTYCDAIEKIREGNKLWGERPSELMYNFRTYVNKK